MTQPPTAPAAGPEGASVLLAARLAETIGDKTWLDAHAARQGYDLTVDPLPTPGLLATGDPGALALEDWPAVIPNATKTLGMQYVDVDSSGWREQLVTYEAEALLFLRGADFTGTDLLRKRYVYAVTEALMSDLGALDLVEGSIRADYSGAIGPDGEGDGDVLGAARVTCQIRRLETVRGPATHGTADTITPQLAPIDEIDMIGG